MTVRRVLAGVGLLLAALIVLVLFLPARWVVPLVQPRLRGVQLGPVHGLLWHGRADALRGADGRALGRVQWRLSRRALWGQVVLDLAWQGTGWQGRGHLERDAQGRQVWTGVSIGGDLAAARLPALPVGQPRGTVALRLERVVLQANWPVSLEGRADWTGAWLQTRDGAVPLGHLRLDLHGEGGVLQGQVHDAGEGPLQVSGQGALSPLGWRAEATMAPRGDQPMLRRWLDRVGRRGADGRWHARYSGGLARPGRKEVMP